MRAAASILLWVLLTCVHAQSGFTVRIADSRLEKIDQKRDAYKRLRAYKKQYSQDSVKLARKYADSLRRMSQTKVPKVPKPDSMVLITQRDSMLWALNELALNHQAEELERIRALGELDSIQLKQLDSLVELNFPKTSRLRQQLDLEKEMKSQFGDALPQQENPLDKIDSLQALVPPLEWTKATGKLGKLKSKFHTVDDINNLKKEHKINSLKGAEPIERLGVGGNLVIHSVYPVTADLDLQIGFRFTRKFRTGVGAIAKYTQSDALTYGYSVFSSYLFSHTFFAYTALESIRANQNVQVEGVAKSWQQEYLLGLGKKIQISRLSSITVMILYDFNYRRNDLHPRPYLMKLGYQLNF